MIEADADVVDVAVHVKADCTILIIPCDVDACILCSSPICGDLVVFSQGCQEVVGVLAAGVLDSKIVDDECKDGWTPFVSP